MLIQKMKKVVFFNMLILLLTGCVRSEDDGGRIRVVTTTNILADLVREIGGDSVFLQSLMAPGVDPHLYKASEGDVMKLFKADVIFYGGLHLEGKMVDIFEQMKRRQHVVGTGDELPREDLIASANFGGNYDPHIWFNVRIFRKIVQLISDELAEGDPANADLYRKNNAKYQEKLDSLDGEVRAIVSELPEEKRILVTAHDAFSYFGKEYGFQVVGLQGISTATEAGVRDVQRIRDLIIEKKIKAIFVESSVPRRTIEALQAAVLARGHQVEIGGFLYSDALGSAGTEEGTYIGMILHNVKTIVNALK